MARVVVRVGENVIESVITRRSAEELGLKQGDAGDGHHQGNRSDDSEGLTRRKCAANPNVRKPRRLKGFVLVWDRAFFLRVG